MLGAFLVNFGPRGWPLGSQMVDLGCQDTNWVGGYNKEVLDGILLQDGLILATLSMDNRNYSYLGCIFGWFGALRGPLGSQKVELGCQDTDWVGGNDKEVLGGL